ncbi:superoxide dismutase [Salmonella enterica subsp. arizonae]|uniref:Superoxide dismutase n=1 Tax=Salmonella enterica subsp. arizonae TaxID=59203 RepID=A0A379TLK4_SALER|nr:superoxide dismutase [Salmonella enterica subsp. arizonae]
MKKSISTFIFAGFFVAGVASAASMKIPMNEVLPSGSGKALGEITVTETPYGLLFQPHLSGLAPGIHGFPWCILTQAVCRSLKMVKKSLR